MYTVLKGMQAFGESKKDAKRKGLDTSRKIYSFKTFHVYSEMCSYYIRYIKERHPECRTLKQCRRYVPEYMKYRESLGLSAWTLSTQNAALCKLFSIKPGDPDWYTPPQRRRDDLKRSRGERVRDRNFSLKTPENAFLVKAASAIGGRRRELSQLKGRDLRSRQELIDEVARLNAIAKTRPLTKEEQTLLRISKDGLLFSKHRWFCILKGKGGRLRISPILSTDETELDEILDRFKQTEPDQKIWPGGISSNLDVHSLRAVYANRVYDAYKKDVNQLPYDKVDKLGRKHQSGVMILRGSKKGLKLCRYGCHMVSRSLGHNREEIFATNYLR